MVLLTLVLALVIAVSQALAGEIRGDWKFPSDIAVSGKKLYVVDGLNNRVAVYDLYGEHLGDIKVEKPFGIYIDRGLLYVTSQEGKLYVMDEYGNIEKVMKLKGRPVDVVKLGNRLYITNGKTNTVDIYTTDGSLLKRVGGKGSAPGLFVGVFMADGGKNLLFVVDTVNARIQEFAPDGRFVRQFGKFGIEEGNIFRPKSVALCGDLLLVSDCITGVVQAFDIYGGFEGVVARNLNFPTAVTCSKGKVFILEPLKNRILIHEGLGAK
jgi:DNA-binding beta-propeller fold protein YncE